MGAAGALLVVVGVVDEVEVEAEAEVEVKAEGEVEVEVEDEDEEVTIVSEEAVVEEALDKMDDGESVLDEEDDVLVETVLVADASVLERVVVLDELVDEVVPETDTLELVEVLEEIIPDAAVPEVIVVTAEESEEELIVRESDAAVLVDGEDVVDAVGLMEADADVDRPLADRMVHCFLASAAPRSEAPATRPYKIL